MAGEDGELFGNGDGTIADAFDQAPALLTRSEGAEELKRRIDLLFMAGVEGRCHRLITRDFARGRITAEVLSEKIMTEIRAININS